MLVIKTLILNRQITLNLNIRNNNNHLDNLKNKIWNMIKNTNMMNKNIYHLRDNSQNKHINQKKKINIAKTMIYMIMI